MKNIFLFLMFAIISVSVSSCEFSKRAWKTTADALDNANIFTYSDDIQLGKQVEEEIKNDPEQFPVLPEAQNREIYNYINELKDVVLSSGKLKYKDEFEWKMHIIDNDEVLNAFATPGGYIYIYTGLIKFLDSEDQLLGVLGHEMAHADQRHSTRQLSKTLGVAILLDAVLGKRDAVEQILGALVSIQFTRAHEEEADEYSVHYLCSSPYNAAGSAGFFTKMENQPQPPEFLSTHPNPANRVKSINDLASSLNCAGTRTNKAKYEKMKALLK
jgi:predicted Zn-dependent protease